MKTKIKLLLNNFLIRPFTKLTLGIINDYRLYFNEYGIHFFATILYLFCAEPILPVMEKIITYKQGIQAPLKSPEILNTNLEDQQLSIVLNNSLDVNTRQDSCILYEYLVEIANDKKNKHRVSVAIFQYNCNSKDYNFNGVNYSNHGEIFCQWKSYNLKYDLNNEKVEYNYYTACFNNSTETKGFGKLYYSKIPSSFTIGSFNDEGEKTITAKYHKLSEVEKKIRYRYDPKDPAVVREFVKRVVATY